MSPTINCNTHPLELTIEAVAEVLKTGKDVIVMCGAGISTSAGIPDFRYSDSQDYL